jgi:glycerol kinase
MKNKNGGNSDAYREDCGLPINTYFSAQKMKWLL